MRDFATEGTQFTKVNGFKTFLRGKHDACVFPLTGYAPMDVKSWRKVSDSQELWHQLLPLPFLHPAPRRFCRCRHRGYLFPGRVAFMGKHFTGQPSPE